jgi:hypothetical protein
MVPWKGRCWTNWDKPGQEGERQPASGRQPGGSFHTQDPRWQPALRSPSHQVPARRWILGLLLLQAERQWASEWFSGQWQQEGQHSPKQPIGTCCARTGIRISLRGARRGPAAVGKRRTKRCPTAARVSTRAGRQTSTPPANAFTSVRRLRRPLLEASATLCMVVWCGTWREASCWEARLADELPHTSEERSDGSVMRKEVRACFTSAHSASFLLPALTPSQLTWPPAAFSRSCCTTLQAKPVLGTVMCASHRPRH